MRVLQAGCTALTAETVETAFAQSELWLGGAHGVEKSIGRPR